MTGDEALSRALGCDLFVEMLDGLEDDTIRTHVWEKTGTEATREQIEDIQLEWTRVRDYLDRRAAKYRRDAAVS